MHNFSDIELGFIAFAKFVATKRILKVYSALAD